MFKSLMRLLLAFVHLSLLTRGMCTKKRNYQKRKKGILYVWVYFGAIFNSTVAHPVWPQRQETKREYSQYEKGKQMCNELAICLAKMHIQHVVPAMWILKDEISSSSFLQTNWPSSRTEKFFKQCSESKINYYMHTLIISSKVHFVSS